MLNSHRERQIKTKFNTSLQALGGYNKKQTNRKQMLVRMGKY